MAVQLLPFQKVVDVPDVAQRHRCAIRGLAISSIVLTSMALCLFATSFMSARQAFLNSPFMALLVLFSSALIIPLFALVCLSSVVSLHNTNLWVSTDVCCNLLRSRPACCTQSCSGNKRCCARLSCAHTAAAVLTSVLCILFICLVHRGCSYDQNDYHDDMGYDNMGSLHYDYYPGVAKGGLCMSPRDLTLGSSTSSPSTLRRNDDICHSYPKHRCGVGNRCLWNNRSAIAEKHFFVPSPSPRPAEATFTGMPSPSPSSRPAEATSTRIPAKYVTKYATAAYTTYRFNYCVPVALFEVPVIILLVSLVATTATSAFLLRRVENGLPALALLPAGKMVVQVLAHQDAMVAKDTHTQVVIGNA